MSDITIKNIGLLYIGLNNSFNLIMDNNYMFLIYDIDGSDPNKLYKYDINIKKFIEIKDINKKSTYEEIIATNNYNIVTLVFNTNLEKNVYLNTYNENLNRIITYYRQNLRNDNSFSLIEYQTFIFNVLNKAYIYKIDFSKTTSSSITTTTTSTSNSFDILSKSPISSISKDDIPNLIINSNLTSDIIKQFTPEQIKAFTPNQIQLFTPEQKQAFMYNVISNNIELTSEQKQALGSDYNLPNLKDYIDIRDIQNINTNCITTTKNTINLNETTILKFNEISVNDPNIKPFITYICDTEYKTINYKEKIIYYNDSYVNVIGYYKYDDYPTISYERKNTDKYIIFINKFNYDNQKNVSCKAIKQLNIYIKKDTVFNKNTNDLLNISIIYYDNTFIIKQLNTNYYNTVSYYVLLLDDFLLKLSNKTKELPIYNDYYINKQKLNIKKSVIDDNDINTNYNIYLLKKHYNDTFLLLITIGCIVFILILLIIFLISSFFS